MSDVFFLSEAVIVFGTAVAVGCLFRLVRAPSIIGFLLAGMAIGPSGWRLVGPENVGPFAELGLVLLLFTVGLELSPEPLLRSGRRLVVATFVQILAIAAAAMAVLQLFTALSFAASAVVGIVVALSSTAIVLKQLGDRGETHSTTGIIITGILLLQDVIVIVLMLFLSLVSAEAGMTWQSMALRTGLGIAGLVATILLARFALPRLLAGVVRHGGREMITLFAVLMACGGAWLASVAGWSPALGACIAGLLLAGADQRHQLVAEITPFRDVFNAMFFVSLGMLANLEIAFLHPVLLVAAILVTLLLKSALTAGAVVLAGWPLRIGIYIGVGLCSVSEFSYVLAHEAQKIQLFPPGALDLLVVYTVGAMVCGALIFPAAGPVAAALAGILRPESTVAATRGQDTPFGHFKNHVIIVGYGFTGANLARMLKSTHVPHCVVEINQELIKEARRAGSPVVVGDATRITILEHAGLEEAHALVIAINDNQATQHIVAQVNARRPEMYLLARTGFLRDIDTLYELGAKLVVPQDFETSIEVAAHILKQFGVPDNIVEAQIAAVRVGGYGMLRGKPTERAAHAELIKILERTATQTFYLADDAYACGQTLAQLDLRALTGCAVIAIVRSGKPTTNPPPDYELHSNDVLVLVGAHRQIEAAKALLQRNEALA